MTLVEVEGTHTIQTNYTSLDIHVGQSYSVLVTADQLPQDYFMDVTTRFSTIRLEATALFSYSNSKGEIAGPVDANGGPSNNDIAFSLKQALSIRTNLTASGPRPNPQGSYHYGLINITRIIRLSNSAALVDNKQRYAINSVSFVAADTPPKIADHFKIPGVFLLGSILDSPPGIAMYLDTSVMAADFRDFVEIIFENNENTVQSYHIDGYSFFVVG
ncbi:L-ascorbate oxidase homolog [Papaver somniferum]|uniref:L-ascorbate oxidase homolog n=1 Tax=Papaver somniferum TaxID=3469 RepID=UPI000E70407B|nr:L-ascorbate oxidase homolog [Papaver somniferum]